MPNQTKIIEKRKAESNELTVLKEIICEDLQRQVIALNNTIITDKEELLKTTKFINDKLEELKKLIENLNQSEIKFTTELKNIADKQHSLNEESKKFISQNENHINKISNIVNDKTIFNNNVSFVVDNKITHLKNNFKENFGNEVTQTIKHQIQNSKDDFVEAIYPILGKMVRKYVSSFIKDLKDGIDKQINETYSFKAIWRKIKGVKNSDQVIGNLAKAEIEEIFIIDEMSTLEIGSYSKNNISDSDLITSMFAALKQFSESIINNKEVQLEYVEFDVYNLMVIKGFKHYYCCVISGVISEGFKHKLNDLLSNFSNKFVPKNISEIDNVLNSKLSINLKLEINEFEKNDK